MWVKANPNPGGKNVPDCVIRAICIALDLPWEKVSKDLSDLANKEYSVTCDDNIWGRYLWDLGFRPFLLYEYCPFCLTVKQFADIFDRGTYIIGTGNHAVAVIDGNYYDTWNSGREPVSFFWHIVKEE